MLKSHSDVAIKVENLSKCYQIYENPHDRLLQMIMCGRIQYYREFWALKNVSFEIPKGQTIGVLGKNGAGKSTLLQILCGTLSPTSGSMYLNGRIAALLELGAGFNPEFTGIENVYLNGQILGLDKIVIDSKIEEIKTFADIGDFIYQPVKTYSSGMFARLAFSVAVHVEPDILIVDEALSVGDSWFQHKSMARMKSLMSRGCTVLFVSHSIESVRALCQKAIWLENGSIKSYGDATVVTNEYMNDVFVEHNRLVIEANYGEKNAEISNASLITPRDLSETDKKNDAAQILDNKTIIQVIGISVVNSLGFSTDKLYQSEQFKIEIHVKALNDIENISIGFLLKDQFGQELIGESVFNSLRKGLTFKNEQTVKIQFSSTMLLRGGQSYSIALRINQVSKWDRSDNVLIYADDLAAVFDVISDPDNPMWFKFKQQFDLKVLYV